MFTITVHAHVQVHVADPDTRTTLARIEDRLAALDRKADATMKANEELKEHLQALDDYTNRLAASAEAQAAASTEIAADVDSLLEGQELSAENKALLESIKAKAETATAAGEALAATLKNIAAKNDDPLPEPVEPVPTV